MDHKGEVPRFSVNYYIHSVEFKSNILIRAKIESDPPVIESVSEIWQNANWLERETYDMFGIEFKNHPDLRRIMMPPEYKDWPLRKEHDWRASKEEAFPYYRPGQWHERKVKSKK
jgi:NADH-quinone oxidoreductase subunit C